MNVCDYSRSFVTFVVPGNNARIGVEGRCVLTMPDGNSEEFLMFASCKSEDTYAERDLFRNPETNPSYDFSGLFSPDRFRIERIFVSSEPEVLDTGLIADRFSEVRRHVVAVPATPLPTKQDVIAATLAGQVVIARNEITDEASGATALLEYPVKTMNVNPERGMFQTDTGPLPYCDFSDPSPDIMHRFRWAYCAFNEFTGAYFNCQAPWPIVVDGQEVARRSHYQEIIHCPQSVNTLFAFD
ncbi:MAG: hypothetical protein KKI08_13080 [Armatimonadetes bacterium]|nr:hypothetical protein [Armatimonadota bacterium]